MDERKKVTSVSKKTGKQSAGSKDAIAELIMKKHPNFAPNLRKNMQVAARMVDNLSREILKGISEIILPLSEIDWSKVNETWIFTAENLGKNGWTIPLQIDLNEMIEIADLKNATDMDKAFGRYYTIEENYHQMREGLLQNDLLTRWDPLLKQSFENYEKGNFQIAIPSLFFILEGFAHQLIYPSYKASKIANDKDGLATKFRKVRADVDMDSIEMAFYASAQFFIKNAFKYANFDDKNAQRPLIINRHWTLHGRDDISQWKDIDALRLFNAIHTLSILDFSSSEEQQD